MLANRQTTPALPQRSFENECIAFFEEIVQLFGVPKSVGQIYGLLYASLTPLGFSSIVERLEVSKGSVSQGLQLLKSLGAIVEAEGKRLDVRGVVYEPELSLRQLVTGILRERITPLAEPGAERLKRLKKLAEASPTNAKFYLSRTKQLETWRKRFVSLMPLLAVLLGPSTRKTRSHRPSLLSLI